VLGLGLGVRVVISISKATFTSVTALFINREVDPRIIMTEGIHFNNGSIVKDSGVKTTACENWCTRPLTRLRTCRGAHTPLY